MTTTYELYTNENGTPKAVEGKAPAIIERVEALEADVETIEGTLDNGVVTSVNDETGEVYVKKLIMGNHVLELQEDGTLKLDENLVITSAGGKMSGTLVLSSQQLLARRDVNDSDIVIFGGTTADNGSYFQATGKDSWGGGEFWIAAKNGTQEAKLHGKPDGNLYWKGVSFRQFGMPNYSAGVEYPWAANNGASSDGWLQIKGSIVADHVNWMQLWIDNVQVVINRVEWNVTQYTTFLVPICKGSSFYAEGTNSDARLTFYPCVGI